MKGSGALCSFGAKMVVYSFTPSRIGTISAVRVNCLACSSRSFGVTSCATASDQTSNEASASSPVVNRHPRFIACPLSRSNRGAARAQPGAD